MKTKTNSFLTHSLIFRWLWEENKNDLKDESSSTIITSPLAKVVWFLDTIKNAETCYKNSKEFKTYSPKHFKGLVVKEAKSVLKKYDNAKYFLKPKDDSLIGELDYNLNKYSYAELIDFIENAGYGEEENLSDISCIMDLYQAREYVLRFKEWLIESYCELEKITRKKAFERFRKARVCKGDPTEICNKNFENYLFINETLQMFFNGMIYPYSMEDPYDSNDAMNFLTNAVIVINVE